jgi:mannosyltransferase
MTGKASPFTDFKINALPVLSILATAFALRFPLLDRTSFWYDEAVSWSQSNSSLDHLLSTIAADNHPPLHNLVLWLWMPFFGDSESALRWPSLIAGVAAVWLLYLLGRELNGRTAGLAAAFLLAISPFHIWYSAEARMYAVFSAAGLAFVLYLVRCLRTGTPGAMLWTAVFGTFFLYSHIYAAFAFAPVGAVLLILLLSQSVGRTRDADRRSRMLRSLVAMVCSGAVFFPWLLVLLKRAEDVTSNGFWIAEPSLAFLTVMARDMAGTAVLFLLLFLLAIAGLAMLFHRRHCRNATGVDPDTPLWILAAFTFGPAAIGYLTSVFVQPILFDRYLIAAWPGLLLLAVLGANRLFPRIGVVLLCTVAIGFTLHPLQHTLLRKLKPEWREISATFLKERDRGAKIHLIRGFAEPALSFYLRDQAEIIPLEPPVTSLEADPEQTIWLLIVHSSDTETEKIRQALPDDFRETGTWRRFGWGQSGLTLIRYDRP